MANDSEWKPSDLPARHVVNYKLRYGENPDQRTYATVEEGYNTILDWEQLWGMQLSFNNMHEFYKIRNLGKGFEKYVTAVIGKHGIVTGFCAIADEEKYKEAILKRINPHEEVLDNDSSLLQIAITKAHECDPQADFGGIIYLNRPCDLETAKVIGRRKKIPQSFFAEGVVCTEYSDKALTEFQTKQRAKKKGRPIRVMKENFSIDYPLDIKHLGALSLPQEHPDWSTPLDIPKLIKEDGRESVYPTNMPPSFDDERLMEVGYLIAARTPSNAAINVDGVVVDGKVVAIWTNAIGTSTKRVGAARMAAYNHNDKTMIDQNRHWLSMSRIYPGKSILIHDGFTPFADGVEEQVGVARSAMIPWGGKYYEQTHKVTKDHGIDLVRHKKRSFFH
jgi:AICAR transformylase/IMP cyclohydrolase PurH